MRAIGEAEPEAFDAIVLDLMEGPSPTRFRAQTPLYGPQALANVRRALVPGGIYAVWGEDDDPGFVERLLRSGFDARRVVVTEGGPRHVVYVARPSRGPRGVPLSDGRGAPPLRPRR
jgi:hypothetical protein